MIKSPIMDVSIILPPVMHSPYVPHEDFRPNSPLSKQRDPPPDADSDKTNTALRFAEAKLQRSFSEAKNMQPQQ